MSTASHYEAATLHLVKSADFTPEQEQAIASIPAALRAAPRWSTWSYDGDSKRPAVAVDKPERWGSFEAALKQLRDEGSAGLGFLLGDGWAGIDLDKCRDPQTGDVNVLARSVVDNCAAYAEISPSKTGLKVFGRSALASIELNTGQIPIKASKFAGNRFFTVTGEVFGAPGSPEADITGQLEFWIERTKDKGKTGKAEPLPETIADHRNTTLHREGSRLRRLGHDEAEILASLRAINQNRCHPPLDEREVETIARSCSGYPTSDDLFPTTEQGDAEFFASLHSDALRYDHRQGRWLILGEHHWRGDVDGALSRRAIDAMRARQRHAIGNKERAKWALGGESRSRQSNMLSLAKNILPIANDGEGWDANPALLGVRNGVVDLRTGVLRPGKPEDRITLVSPLAYDAQAPTTKWARFVLDICNGDQVLADYLRVSLGYILSGETGEQCFWIFFGLGSNGKSTLLETISRYVMPEHSWSMNFPSHTWSESMSEYQRAELVGRRLVVAKESEQAKKLNTEFIKSLTGDETIAARHPYCRPFNFRPVAKFVLAVNHKPVIRDETHGMWRRVRLVPFLRTFPVDPSFAESLVAEADGVLAWLVQGAVEYYRDGLHAPESVLAATRNYQQESNVLAPFFAERCVFDAAIETRAHVLFSAYRAWCDTRQVPDSDRLSQNEFGARIAGDSRLRVEERGGKPPKRGVFYVGVGLLAFAKEEL